MRRECKDEVRGEWGEVRMRGEGEGEDVGVLG